MRKVTIKQTLLHQAINERCNFFYLHLQVMKETGLIKIVKHSLK